jgi:hypothetical protein
MAEISTFLDGVWADGPPAGPDGEAGEGIGGGAGHQGGSAPHADR